MTWKDLLKTAGTEQTMNRAHSALSKKTIYKLGKGGLDPTKPIPQCDCSGFIAWAIGIPRELPPASGKWLSTDEYWAGGKPVKAGLFQQVPLNEAQAGDLMVYPDPGPGRQGHIGLISQVDNGIPTYVIHCSNGNYKNFGDAIRITTPGVFLTNNHPTRVMRINYELLKTFGFVLAPAAAATAKP